MFEDMYTSGDYLKKNPTWHVRESPWKAREIVRMMVRNNLVPKTICEVGCGAGEVLKQLQKSMDDECMLCGYEISPQAFELCKTRTNEKLHFKLADIRHEEDAFFAINQDLAVRILGDWRLFDTGKMKFVAKEPGY